MIDRMHAATLQVLYNVLLIIALPVIWIRLVFKGRMERRSERFGRLPESIPKGAVWFHTVSAGETIAAAPLIRELAISCPEISFLVTTMTPTGSEQVESLLGDVVDHAYAPYDFPWAVGKARSVERETGHLHQHDQEPKERRESFEASTEDEDLAFEIVGLHVEHF